MTTGYHRKANLYKISSLLKDLISFEFLDQACQTGGPIASQMRPAAILFNHTITQN